MTPPLTCPALTGGAFAVGLIVIGRPGTPPHLPALASQVWGCHKGLALPRPKRSANVPRAGASPTRLLSGTHRCLPTLVSSVGLSRRGLTQPRPLLSRSFGRGRAAAGFKGSAGDCVCRAIAIASGRPYKEVYDRLAEGVGTQRITKQEKRRHERKGWAPPKKQRSAANGVSVKRLWFRRYMHELGFEWIATMQIGSGCKVHLADGELPMGRLVGERQQAHGRSDRRCAARHPRPDPRRESMRLWLLED
jgi:hypothetical protein